MNSSQWLDVARQVAEQTAQEQADERLTRYIAFCALYEPSRKA